MAMAIAMTDIIFIRLKREEFMRQRGEQHWMKLIINELDL
jgi:hypothetical protein